MDKFRWMFVHRQLKILLVLPYIGKFSRQGILVKMALERCFQFSLSPIFDI